jgi:ankyrin repeat protein
LKVDSKGRNALHSAALGGSREAVEWVLANNSIDVNSVDTNGYTSIMDALGDGHNEAAYCLVENGANLFMKNSEGERAIDTPVDIEEGDIAKSEEAEVAEIEEADRVVLGPQVLQHAIEFRWTAAKPLLLLSKACSSEIIHPVNPSIAIPSSLISALGNSDIIRKEIGPFLLRGDVLVRDPSIARPPKAPDAVELRIEAGLAAASSSRSSSSSSSNNKRARED